MKIVMATSIHIDKNNPLYIQFLITEFHILLRVFFINNLFILFKYVSIYYSYLSLQNDIYVHRNVG